MSNQKPVTSVQRGITLIEILVVVAVLGILASIVIPRVGRNGLYDKHTVYTTARQIGADMRLARRLAIATGDSHKVVFLKTMGSSDHNAYKIQHNTGGSWVDVGETKSILGEIIVSGADEIQFNSNGSANANLDFEYELIPYIYNINVKQATGRVKITTY